MPPAVSALRVVASKGEGEPEQDDAQKSPTPYHLSPSALGVVVAESRLS